MTNGKQENRPQTHFLFSVLYFPLNCTSKHVEMSNEKQNSMFSKDNYIWMLIGAVVIALGMILMSGGKSNTNPAEFDAGAVYSARRITIAPILILLGLVIEIWAIFKKPKQATA